MAVSLFDVSVRTYEQILDSTSNVLAKGREHFGDTDVEDIVKTRLHEDMLPFWFQIHSVVHHSLGALKGTQSGLFLPPPSLPDMNYQGLQDFVSEARAELAAFSPEIVNAFEGKAVSFKLGDFEMPFKGEDFLLTFSLPNFYFHAATTYDILRMKGVPLGKRDYMGQPRLSL